jgi:hypothetical protein
VNLKEYLRDSHSSRRGGKRTEINEVSLGGVANVAKGAASTAGKWIGAAGTALSNKIQEPATQQYMAKTAADMFGFTKEEGNRFAGIFSPEGDPNDPLSVIYGIMAENGVIKNLDDRSKVDFFKEMAKLIDLKTNVIDQKTKLLIESNPKKFATLFLIIFLVNENNINNTQDGRFNIVDWINTEYAEAYTISPLLKSMKTRFFSSDALGKMITATDSINLARGTFNPPSANSDDLLRNTALNEAIKINLISVVPGRMPRELQVTTPFDKLITLFKTIAA